MKEINRILFPVDLSEASAKIVPWVKELAESFQAEVEVLFVARDMQHYAGVGVPYSYIADLEGAVLDGVRDSLLGFVRQQFEGALITTAIVRGYPSEEILDYCRERDIDMIVIGTHGRKGLQKILFGSVAEYVVKNAPVPVLVVNPFRA